jgi:hypothetical protein
MKLSGWKTMQLRGGWQGMSGVLRKSLTVVRQLHDLPAVE